MRVTSSLRLNADESMRIWNWVLARQGLRPGFRLGSAEAVASAAIGLHAARLPTPVVTLAARSDDSHIPLSLLRERDTARMTTIRCMRRTLHMMPVHLAAIAHQATLAYRERDALRQAAKVGADASSLRRATDAITAALSQGPLAHREIEHRLSRCDTPVHVIRAALKLAWERGTLTYINQSTSWNREVRTFFLTSIACPGLLEDLAPESAIRQLVTTYFDRYGPATIGDAAWWSALSRKAVTQAMSASGISWVQVDTPWSASPAYMSADRYEEFRSTGEHLTGVALLAQEDVALKAYFETRQRYLAGLNQSLVFNSIGEVAPTIISNGEIIGRWTWKANNHSIEADILVSQLQPIRTAIDNAIGGLTATLRAGCAPPRRAPRHRVQGQLTLPF